MSNPPLLNLELVAQAAYVVLDRQQANGVVAVATELALIMRHCQRLNAAYPTPSYLQPRFVAAFCGRARPAPLISASGPLCGGLFVFTTTKRPRVAGYHLQRIGRRQLSVARRRANTRSMWRAHLRWKK